MRSHYIKYQVVLVLVAGLVPRTALGQAQNDDSDKKKPNMHQLARSSALQKAEADFSMFKYRPPGDKIIEQPDANRLLFKNPDGAPDGYAQRRGNAIIYYDRTGKVSHVQNLN